jgi:ABC-2 type transport system ATP-binding protein
MLLALVEPTSGAGRVLGAPLGDRATRARIGFLPEHFRFHETLTATELLRFHGRLYGLRGVSLDARVDRGCWCAASSTNCAPTGPQCFSIPICSVK